MFFFLSKSLSFFLNPLFYALLGLSLIGCFLYKRKPVLKWFILWVSYLLIIFSPLSLYLLESYENQLKTNLPESVDAIIVLGSNSLYYHEQSDQFQIGGSFSRTLEGIRLFKKLKPRYLIFSGGEPTPLHPELMNEAQSSKKLAIEMGVDESDIYVEDQSYNTFQEARMIQPWCEKNLINNLIVITDASHMPRALKVFQKQKLNSFPYPVNHAVRRDADRFTFNMQNIVYWRILLHEVVGTFAYNFKGYL